MNHHNHRILIVDDMPSIHDDFRKILTSETPDAEFDELEAQILGSTPPFAVAPNRPKIQLVHTYQGEEALQTLRRSIEQGRPLSVAFVDMRMPPGWDGLETISRLQSADPRLQIVLCTAYSDHTWTRITEILQPTDNILILKKPFDAIEVQQLVHTLTSKWSLQRQAESRIEHLDTLARDRGVALATAEQRFSAAFLGGSQACAIVELPEGRIVLSNPSLQRLLHSTQSPEGLTIREALPWAEPTTIGAMLDRLSTDGNQSEVELTLPDSMDDVRIIRLTASPFLENGRAQALLGFTDVSEHHRLEAQLRQSQKMEAVGSLAAGIAHDFNNMLTVIQGFTTLAHSNDKLPAGIREQLDMAILASERAADLTRNLLLFSRRKPNSPVEVDPAEVVLRMRTILHRLIPENIRIDWHCPRDVATVKVDVVGFEQTVLNLVVNARDAMPDGGHMAVDISRVEIQKRGETGAAEPRPFVCLSVSDDGCGMSPEVQARIFEPFFTQKEPGKGTGLGLATVFAMTKRHHGWIDVKSEPGAGSTFSVYLPLAGTKVSESFSPLSTMPDIIRRHARILVVEDDSSVRQVLQNILSHHGFEFELAGSGPEALQLWEEHNGNFDLLLTDFILPGGMNGREIASELRAHNPDLPVLVGSGYDGAEQPASPLPGRNAATFIAKPYNPAALLMAIENAFAETASSV